MMYNKPRCMHIVRETRKNYYSDWGERDGQRCKAPSRFMRVVQDKPNGRLSVAFLCGCHNAMYNRVGAFFPYPELAAPMMAYYKNVKEVTLHEDRQED